MKLSETRNISDILKKIGIQEDPKNMTPEDLEKLAKNPAIRSALFHAFGGASRNVYQELEMDSPYVNTHRDVSYVPESLQLHSHSFYEILYCESGSIQYLIADKRYRIHAGDIVLVPPGVSHRPIFYDEMTEPYSRIVLWISADFLRTLSDYCPDDLVRRLRAQEHFLLRTEGTPYKYVETLFKRGVLEATEASPLWEMSLYSNTVTLLVHLCRAMLYTDSIIPIEKKEEIDKIIT